MTIAVMVKQMRDRAQAIRLLADYPGVDVRLWLTQEGERMEGWIEAHETMLRSLKASLTDLEPLKDRMPEPYYRVLGAIDALETGSGPT